MSIAAAQYDKFKKQIIKEGKVYSFTQDDEYLVYPMADKEVIPFWSSKDRLQQIQERYPKYQGYAITELTFDEFYKWLPTLKDDNVSIGVNWSGERLIGYDVDADELVKSLDYFRNKK